jgi:signal transduction histidine kinase
VTVGLERTGNRIRLTVEDRGPGIPSKFRERVFEPFCRLDRERQTAVAGAGIGLSVVRDLATLHGGRAFVESRAEGGSRFIVELPGVLVNGESGELSPVAAA